MVKKYTAALYCRLSKDDLSEGDSSSIITQKIMLENYCKTNKFGIYDYYIDDGYSGANFNRPEFERMLNDIDSGKINMVITKDLSRLGRDYIMTGYYTEIYFATNNIRYIAITDNYDSLNNNNDIAPFRNILNDMYARDISRKIKSAKLSRAKQGYYIGSIAPYGYKLDHKNNSRFIVDDEAAKVVRLIFGLAAKGNGSVKISKYLEDKKIICPAEYKSLQGSTRFDNCASRNYNKYKWNTATVLKILNDRTYLGEMTCHKTETINYKTKQIKKIPKEGQILTHNAHEKIIDEDLFNKVQEVKKNRYEKTNFTADNIFIGYIRCSACGCRMTFAHRSNGKAYYRCMYSYRHPEAEKHINSIEKTVIENCIKKKLNTIVKLFNDNDSAIYLQEKDGIYVNAMKKYIDRIVVAPQKKKNAHSESRVQIIIKKNACFNV